MIQEQLNQVMPGWKIIRKLGQGGYGGVYEIQRRLPTGRVERSALKHISIPQSQEEIEVLLRQSVTSQSISEHYEQQMKKLIQEYSIMQKLGECPNIVDCQDVCYLPNSYGWEIFIRMELLYPLKQVLDNQYREALVLKIGIEMCEALQTCHGNHILHRDVKPENILVAADGTFKLGDFGIARNSEKTQTMTMIGTYGYMAPEVARRERYGSAADVYSLGIVLYWLMNNKTLPFLPLPPMVPTAQQREEAVNRRIAGEILPRPQNGSPELWELVQQMCAWSVQERLCDIAEIQSRLRTCQAAKEDSVKDVLQELGLSPAQMADNLTNFGVETPVFTPEAVPEAKTGVWKKRIIGIGAGLAALAAMGAVLGFGMLGKTKAVEAAPKQTEAIVQETQAQTTPTTLPVTVPTELPTTEPTKPETTPTVQYSYEIVNGGAVITGLKTENVSELVLPDTLGGAAVKAIAENAFRSNMDIKKVQIPDTVTEIGENAFESCIRLQQVGIPASLKTIGAGAFQNCSSLSQISLPSGVEKLGTRAFMNCKRLTEISIPKSVSSMGEYCFCGCEELQELQIQGAVEKIENFTFYDCRKLRSIVLPEGLKEVGVSAFANCALLETVTFPASIRTLQPKAFQGTALKTIAVPSSCSLGEGSIPIGCTQTTLR